MNNKNSRRGLLLIGFFLLCVLLAGGVLGGTWIASGTPKRSTASAQGPLTAAKVAFVDGEFLKAEKKLRDVLEGEPGNLEAKILLGRVLLERGRIAQARDVFTEVLKENEKNFEATRGLARAYEGEGRRDLAAIYYERAAQLRPDSSRAWRELALCNHAMGDAMGAMTAIQKSLGIDSDQADLTTLMSELAIGKLPGRNIPGLPAPPGQKPFQLDPLRPGNRNFQPQPPDPRSMLPKPGGKQR